MTESEPVRYRSFRDFYPFYISQHRNPICRGLHVLGTLLSMVWFFWSIATGRWVLLPFFPVLGYGLSWIGHYLFERNTPAAFTYFTWSFVGDLRMCFEVLTFQRRLNENP